MGTRSSIFVTFTSKKTKKPVYLRYYKHYDGYPTHNLELISRLISEVKTNKDVKAAFQSAASKNDFARIEFEGSKTTLQDAVSHNEHGDLEWSYLVDLSNKTVKVARSNDGESKNLVLKRYANPLSYADQLIESYQDGERQEIQSHIDTLKAQGFKVN